MVFIPPLITKKPSLGRIPKDAPKETRQFLKSLKEILEVGEGKRGDSMDRYLTLRHLRDAGLVESLSNGAIIASPNNQTFDDISTYPGYTTQVPEAPVNVSVTGGFSYIFVSWDIPVDASNIISHAEVWRSETDALGAAVLRGTSPSSFYMDEVGTGSVTYFYWVRFVSKWGTAESPINGPYNAVAGTSGATVLDPAYVLETLEGQITSSQLNTSLNTLIDKIEPNELAIATETQTRATETGELYGSWTMKIAYDGATPYVAGMGLAVDVINGNPTSNMIIAADNFAVRKPGSNDFFLTAGTVNGVQTVGIGSAHIHDLAVTNAAIQNVAADKLFAETGTIANAIIGSGHIQNAMIGNVIQSNNYVPNVSGWLINKDGFAELQNAKVTGNITANSIDANAANIISTLMLQDQAVTFPVSFWNPNYTSVQFFSSDLGSTLSGGSGFYRESVWKSVCSISFNSTGAPKNVSGFFRYDIVNNGVGANYSSKGGTVLMVVYFRVAKNGGNTCLP